MKSTLLIFTILFLSSTSSWAISPEKDFKLNKGVGEASLRVIRSFKAPDPSMVKESEIKSSLFSESCGVLGCIKVFLSQQTFLYSDISKGSVAALIGYDIQGNLEFISVIAESGRQ